MNAQRSALSLLIGLAALGVGQGLGAERWALLIGINDYQRVGDLRFCEQDARALGKVLVERAGFLPERVVTLTSSAPELKGLATIGNMRGCIKQFTSLPAKGDTVIIFFAGHSDRLVGENYLLPLDGDRDPKSAISLTWVRKCLAECRASTRLLILDTCRPGSERGSVAIALPPGDTPGVTMFSSCAPGQTSHEEEGRGVFSRFLCEGLGGAADGDANGEVTQVELYDHVLKRMTDWSVKTRKTQVPQVSPPREALPKSALVRIQRKSKAQEELPEARQPTDDETEPVIVIRPEDRPSETAEGTVAILFAQPEDATLVVGGREFPLARKRTIAFELGRYPFKLVIPGKGTVYGRLEVLLASEQTEAAIFGYEQGGFFKPAHIRAALEGRPVIYTLPVETEEGIRTAIKYTMGLRPM